MKRAGERRCENPPYLDVTQRAAENTQVGGFLLVHVWDIFLQRLEALFEVCSPKGSESPTERGQTFSGRKHSGTLSQGSCKGKDKVVYYYFKLLKKSMVTVLKNERWLKRLFEGVWTQQSLVD